MEVLIQPLRRVIEVAPGANLLEALRRAQLPMSHSCMAGRCGTCRCKVLHGEVLDAGRELQNPLDACDDYVLACQTFVTEPCTIEIPEPDEVVVHPACSVRATVQSVEALTRDVVRLVLKPAKAMQFSPGQYAQLQFTPDHVRPYAMAGLAADPTLEFHVRVFAGGRVSGYIANHLAAGSSVKVSGPLGAAYLRHKHQGPILCVAGGTGLASILSIVRGAVESGMRNPIHLYAAARSARDVYEVDRLRELQTRHPELKVHIVVASGEHPPEFRRGLVVEAIRRDLGHLAGWHAYLCGSPPMVEAAAVLTRQKGIEPGRVYAEAFYPQAA
jgi:naphthalene 1,2-dioxygenase ferredoxin reductase component